MAVEVGSLLVSIGADVARMQRDLGKVNHQVNKSVGQMKSAFGGLAAAIGGVFAVGGVADFGRAVFDAGRRAQQLERSMKAISGARAGEELAFVRQTADELGLSLYDTADAYKVIAASAKGTALEGKATQDVFRAVSEASTVLGLSMDDTRGALTALSQMISKGKVSAEELRQQLGERLPGAFQLAARAMGVSTAELDKMLSQGQVLAEDLLPALARELHATYGKEAVSSADGAAQAVNRLTTAWDDFKVTVAESGFLDLATRSLNNLAETARDVTDAIRQMNGETLSPERTLSNMQRELRRVEAAMAQPWTMFQEGMDAADFDAIMGATRERAALLRDAIRSQQQIIDAAKASGAGGSGVAPASTPDPANQELLQKTRLGAGLKENWEIAGEIRATSLAAIEVQGQRRIAAEEEVALEIQRLTLDETAFAIAQARAREEAWVAEGVKRELAAEATALRIVEIEANAAQERIREEERMAERQARATGQLITAFGQSMAQMVTDSDSAWATIVSTAINAMTTILTEWMATQAAMRAAQAGSSIFGATMSNPGGDNWQRAGATASDIPGRASGGPVWPGRWLVGENGPEVLDLSGSGRGYVHNASATRAMGAQSPKVEVNIHNNGQSQVETSERTGMDGQIILDVVIHAAQRGDQRFLGTMRRALNG